MDTAEHEHREMLHRSQQNMHRLECTILTYLHHRMWINPTVPQMGNNTSVDGRDQCIVGVLSLVICQLLVKTCQASSWLRSTVIGRDVMGSLSDDSAASPRHKHEDQTNLTKFVTAKPVARWQHNYMGVENC